MSFVCVMEYLEWLLHFLKSLNDFKSETRTPPADLLTCITAVFSHGLFRVRSVCLCSVSKTRPELCSCRVTSLLSLFQESWSPTPPSFLWAAPQQNKPPPPSSHIPWSSSCLGPRASETRSFRWEERATWPAASPAAAGLWGETDAHQAAVRLGSSTLAHRALVSSCCRAAVLDRESESSGSARQSLLEGISAQPQSNEGGFSFKSAVVFFRSLHYICLCFHCSRVQEINEV